MDGKKLKSYMTLQKLVARKFRQARDSDWVIWGTMACPTWLLMGFDENIVPIYPQLRNMLQGKNYTADSLETAAHHMYNSDLCSDLRCEIGKHYMYDELRPKEPKPDFLLGMNFTCNASVGIYNNWLELYPEVDHFVVDVPYTEEDELSESAVDYVRAQLVKLIEKFEKILKIPFDMEKFRKAARMMATNQNLILEVLKTARHNPSPISVTSFQPYLIPLAYYAFYQETNDYLVALLNELETIAANPDEEKEEIRLLWDFLPIYKHMGDIDEVLKDHKAKMVMGTSLTSTFAWPKPEEFDVTDDPLRLQAYAYVQHYFKRNYKYKYQLIEDWVKFYNIDGIVFHSSRNCRANSLPLFLIKEQMEKKYNIPTLVVEADVLEPKVYSKSQLLNRLEAFLETF